MKRILFIACLCCLVLSLAAQRRFAVYGIGFYNLENLFDTCHDEGKNDYEYLPGGTNKWSGLKYTRKLANMSRALADMGGGVLPGLGCAAIGVSEVENAKALADLCEQPPLKERGFQFVHIEGPDHRGVDCALLYNPKLFSVRDAKLVPYVYDLPQDSNRATRGFLTVSGTLADEHVAIIVCHLPSRFAGSYYRELGAKQIRVIKDSLLINDPDCKVFVMGDMNDDPNNLSMMRDLGGKPEIEDVTPEDMYNPWYNVLVKQRTGTLMYQGKWNLFDQILMTPNVLKKKGDVDVNKLKFWKHEVQRMPYLFQKEGRYKGGPLRTHAGGVWLDGYSDHLPVVVYLMKELP